MSYNKEQNTLLSVSGPYYNGKQAAKYCGYSHDHFRHLASEYQIPRYGVRMNRYAQSTLNQWMQQPSCFKFKVSPKKKTLKKLEA